MKRLYLLWIHDVSNFSSEIIPAIAIEAYVYNVFFVVYTESVLFVFQAFNASHQLSCLISSEYSLWSILINNLVL